MAVVDPRVLDKLVIKLLTARVGADSLVIVWVSVSMEIDVIVGASLYSSDRSVGLVGGLTKLKRWWKARGVCTENALVMEDIAVMLVAVVAMVRPEYVLLVRDPQMLGMV